MMTNWLVKFVDGTHEVVGADCINDAFMVAHETYGKHPRSASFHSSYTDATPAVADTEFGFGYGPVTA